MAGNCNDSVIYSGKTITASSGAIQSILTVLGTTDDNRMDGSHGRRVRWIEIRAHAAAFYVGNSDHSDKDTVPAYEPYFRECTKKHLEDTYLRAVADAAISNVVIEVGYAGPA